MDSLSNFSHGTIHKWDSCHALKLIIWYHFPLFIHLKLYMAGERLLGCWGNLCSFFFFFPRNENPAYPKGLFLMLRRM